MDSERHVRRLERVKALISGSSPLALEGWLRAIVIHYFFHVSDKQGVEVLPGDDGQPARSVNIATPTVFRGPGRIRLGATTVFGVTRSPGSYSCTYVEARTPQSLVEIGNGTVFNNRAVIISEGAAVRIGRRCLIGFDFHVLDSNAHQLELGRRHLPDDRPQPVVVEDDVFIGGRVTLLKGCHIGRGSVISAGAVVPPGFVAPPMSIVAGNPARVVGQVRGASTDEAAGPPA
jgi:acetyltransferase-like isoleucine patch superfamily enzyme